MTTKRKHSATPQNNEPSSSKISGPLSPVIPGDSSLESSSSLPVSDFPPSYRPPGVAPSTPTLPPSETVESPSSKKSSPTSPPPRTKAPAAPSPSSDEEPAKDPVQGCGGIAYLTYAAAFFPDEKFRDYYEHRAADLVDLHGDQLTPETIARLKKLF